MSGLDQLLPSFPVFPFPKTTRGYNLKFYLTFHTGLSAAWTNCPKCGYKDNLFRGSSGITIGYCRGGLPVEVEHESKDVFGQSQGKHSHQIICAHISFEHFHAACQVCDFTWGFSIPGGM